MNPPEGRRHEEHSASYLELTALVLPPHPPLRRRLLLYTGLWRAVKYGGSRI